MNEPSKEDIEAAYQHALWLRQLQEPLGRSDRIIADLGYEVNSLRNAQVIGQVLRAINTRPTAPTMPELIAQRKGEIAESQQPLRTRIAIVRKSKSPEPTLFKI